jgi:hypothetical protein
MCGKVWVLLVTVTTMLLQRVSLTRSKLKLLVEAIYGEDFVIRRKIEVEVFDYIEHFYNTNRKHSACGFRSLEQFETEDFNNLKVAA